MPLSRLPLPSFALTLTGSNGDSVVRLQDFHPGATSVEVNLQLPQFSVMATAPALTQPHDQDSIMQTVDARFQGQLEYQACYTTEAGKVKEAEDNQSETGTVFELSPVVLAQELHPFGEPEYMDRLRQLRTRGNPLDLATRLNVKFYDFWCKLRRLGRTIVCRDD